METIPAKKLKLKKKTIDAWDRSLRQIFGTSHNRNYFFKKNFFGKLKNRFLRVLKILKTKL